MLPCMVAFKSLSYFSERLFWEGREVEVVVTFAAAYRHARAPPPVAKSPSLSMSHAMSLSSFIREKRECSRACRRRR